MSAAAKKLVISFFESEAFQKKEVLKNMFIKIYKSIWHSSTGYNVYDFDGYWGFIESASLIL